MIFKIQNFNFGTLANQRMSYQEDLIIKNITEPSDRTTKRPKGQVSMRQIFNTLTDFRLKCVIIITSKSEFL